MKKIVCLLVAVLLCLSFAMAESVPSKTTGDLTKFETTAENLPADVELVVAPVVSDSEDYAAKVEACEAEIAKLAAEEVSVVEYFGEVKDAEGNVVDLAAVLESETLNVFEFAPIVVENYEEQYGKVTVTMQFATPYAADEKVVVLIGLVTVNADNTQSVEWTAYDATVSAEGTIAVELQPETLLAIQNGTALVAVVSK